LDGFLEKKHRSIIWGQNYPKQLCDGVLYWTMAIADILVAFETSLGLEKYDFSKWIRQ
jgi:hypothetical protein